MKKIIFTLFFLFVFIFGYSQKPEMVFVEGGSVYMGNEYSGALDEKPEHKVTLSNFYISKYEVTFDMFDHFCKSTGYPLADDGGFKRGQNPLINVSWMGAIKFCNWLSTRFGYDRVYNLKIDSSGTTIRSINWNANGYRLPTEAEWEYVAKGGSKSKGYIYPGSNNADSVAWYLANSQGRPHKVGTKKPNELGVYDISGNAFEWCWDYYNPDYYKNSPENNPHGPDKGIHRIYRGGYFNSDLDFIRITKRFALAPNLRTGLIGIRLARNANAN